jgi:hypothetical protein
MGSRWGVAVVFSLGCVASAQSTQKAGDWGTLVLSYNTPSASTDFGGALPIGNGRMGAKIFGAPAAEHLDISDATFWSGGPYAPTSTAHRSKMQAIQAAVAKGDYISATNLVVSSPALSDGDTRVFQPLGAIDLAFSGTGGYTGYSRTLELDRAVVTIKYTVGGVTYTRETFASYPDQAIVTRVYGSKAGSVGFTAALSTQQTGSVSASGANEIVMTGRAPWNARATPVVWDATRGMKFEAHLKITTSGGTVAANGKNLVVAGADTAVLIFSEATSFNGYDKEAGTQGADQAALVKSYLARTANKTFDQILSAHLADYRAIFRRLWLDVDGQKPNLYAKLYQCSRYSLISCSRPGYPAPRNEQGIWNRDVQAHYASNYTLNENPEKFYALAEPANIQETSSPLIDFVGELSQAGVSTAKNIYGARGWVTHHNSDIFAMTTPATGRAEWALWPMGGIWLCENVWDRYAFGMDKAYLRDTAYAILKGAAQFALDILVDDGKGHLVTSPSTSPENKFITPQDNKTAVSVTYGSTMDMSLLRELFGHIITATKVLGTDAAFADTLSNAMAKFLPYQIGSTGQLLEYPGDWGQFEAMHRHASHLISVWPLATITQRGTPTFFAAAAVALTQRGTGGYHPDKCGMWARLLQGDKALANYGAGNGGTTWPALYEAPPEGVGEMLLQSQTGDIDLLPALPTAWTSGNVLGMRARGGYEVDISWSANAVTKATIRSYQGTTPTVRIKGQLVTLPDPRITVQYVTTGIAPRTVTASATTMKISLRGNQYRVDNPFQGAYVAKLRDLQGRVVATASGVGPGEFQIPAPSGRTGLFLLDLEAQAGKVRQDQTVPVLAR